MILKSVYVKFINSMLLVSIMVSCTHELAYSGSLEALIGSMDSNHLQCVMFWEVRGDKLCCLTRPKDGSLRSSLSVFRLNDGNMVDIGTFELGAISISLFEFSGKLISLCQTGTGYLIDVYDYREGKLKLIISDGSYLQPEFVCLGSSTESSISVPKLEWVNGEKIPVFANVYVIQQETVREFKNTPWEKRFSILNQ